MRKNAVVLVFVALLACAPAFAQSDISMSGMAQFVAGTDGIDLTRFTIMSNQTTYVEENASGFAFRVGIGADLFLEEDDSETLFGFSVDALCGATIVLNEAIRFDILGGVNVFESSLTVLVTKKIAHEDEYRLTVIVQPVADASVLFGMGAFSFRLGARAGFQFADGNSWQGLSFTPYISVGAAFLDFLNLFV